MVRTNKAGENKYAAQKTEESTVCAHNGTTNPVDPVGSNLYEHSAGASEASMTTWQDGMEDKSHNWTSLEALQDQNQLEVMDSIDRLRRIGLQQLLKLPSLVVCGDQSSGKSSVLEAITEVPFPRKTNLCTRYATELVLRRASEDTIKATITPDKSRSAQEIKKFESFAKTIVDLSELPLLMEEATEAMGLNDHSGFGQAARAFSRDILKIEISGPGRPQL